MTVYQPGDFRPFNFSIFQASIPKLRKQWLFYDLLSADSITGQVDGCLMSLHKPQTISRTNETEQERESQRGSRWKTMSRFRVDGVNIDHIQNQSDLTGPLSWILSSRFDVVMDIKFPKDLSDDVDINTIISEIVENLTIAVSGDPFPLNNEEGDEGPIPGQSRLSGPAIEAPVTTVGPGADRAREAKQKQMELEEEKFKEENDWREQRRRRWRDRMRRIRERRNGNSSPRNQLEESESLDSEGHQQNQEKDDDSSRREKENDRSLTIPPSPSVVIDMDVRFKDTKAAVPLFTRDISYKNNAFVRPIVAFMNAHKVSRRMAAREVSSSSSLMKVLLIHDLLFCLAVISTDSDSCSLPYRNGSREFRAEIRKMFAHTSKLIFLLFSNSHRFRANSMDLLTWVKLDFYLWCLKR